MFQVWPTHLQAAVRVRYRHSVERGKEVPLVRLRLRNSNSLHKDLKRFRMMNSPEGGQGLPGGATAPYASVPPPPPKAASGCGSMPGSPTGQQEVFSTAQMTQIAQIVSLSLNQAMGEFNMRLNGLQTTGSSSTECVCSGTGAASCITTSSGTSCEDITFYLKWFVIIWRLSTHQSTTQFSKEHCGTTTRFAAVASETD